MLTVKETAPLALDLPPTKNLSNPPLAAIAVTATWPFALKPAP